LFSKIKAVRLSLVRKVRFFSGRHGPAIELGLSFSGEVLLQVEKLAAAILADRQRDPARSPEQANKPKTGGASPL
jgi:hypothetical protein